MYNNCKIITFLFWLQSSSYNHSRLSFLSLLILLLRSSLADYTTFATFFLTTILPFTNDLYSLFLVILYQMFRFSQIPAHIVIINKHQRIINFILVAFTTYNLYIFTSLYSVYVFLFYFIFLTHNYNC